MDDWYIIDNIEKVDSPSVVLYEDRLSYNLATMLTMVDNDPSKIIPHIKTNKMPEVIKRMITFGIKHFKSSTIAEAEIAAREGAESVLIAHQLAGPKIKRLCKLIQHYSNTSFSTIIDTIAIAEELNEEAEKSGIIIDFYIDINNGMNRSGIELGTMLDELIEVISEFKSLSFKGLHVYDGHLRDVDFQERNNKIETGFREVEVLFQKLNTNNNLQLICGGTPSFTSHSIQKKRISSPGTCVLWDWGYSEKLTEQNFKYAALIVCRVISKPTQGIITVDLGHKAIAAENPITQRIKFLNLDNYKLRSQSEEHGVLEVDDWDAIQVSDVFYGVPYHICPTINLHDYASVIQNGKKITEWEITARKRKITI